MLTVNKLISQGQGFAPILIKRAATLELPWDVRQKSRFEATDSLGRHLGVFLPRGLAVRGGDVLVAEDGSLVRVTAAPQPLLVVKHSAAHGSPFDLIRAAYHLGNRHVALHLEPDSLRLEPDHVLAEMLTQMGLMVTEALAAFEPESGAYGLSRGSHAHGHDDHPSHTPAGSSAAVAASHVHGPSCQHDHGPHALSSEAKKISIAVPIKVLATPHVHGPGCHHGHEHDDPH
jgi:urease accessory protein